MNSLQITGLLSAGAMAAIAGLRLLVLRGLQWCLAHPDQVLQFLERCRSILSGPGGNSAPPAA